MAEIIFYFLSLTSIFKISWQSSVQYRNATSRVPEILHSNNVTMDATHCSSNMAACHGYIKKMMVFYKSVSDFRLNFCLKKLKIEKFQIKYVGYNVNGRENFLTSFLILFNEALNYMT